MNADQMKELVARLRRYAAWDRVNSTDQRANDLDAAADLIEQMAQAEPVAWAATDESGTVIEALGMNQSRRFDTALYLAPPARGPLRDGQIIDMANKALPGWTRRDNDLAYIEVARAIEQAHGIGSEK